MLRVGRGRYESPPTQAEQIILAHQAQHAFVVHDDARPPQLERDRPVAIGLLRQRHTMNHVAYGGLRTAA